MGLEILIILIGLLVQNKKVSVHHFSRFPKKTNLFHHLVYLLPLPNWQQIETLKSIVDKAAVNSEQFRGCLHGESYGSKRCRTFRH